MKSLMLESRGIHGISLKDAKIPERKNDNILIKIKAASLNQVDIYMRDNGAGIRHSLPLIMGVDGVGEVADASQASNFKIGDPVILYPYEFCGTCPYCMAGEQQFCNQAKIPGEHRDGTFAEYISIPERSLFHLPKQVDELKASTLGVAYLTAWRMVISKAKASPGKSILVMGGGGGVALAAIDIARMVGCTIYATTSGSRKISKLTSYGVDHVLDYKSDNIVKCIKELTLGDGVDIVIDNVGEATWDQSLKCVKKGGSVITCGATTGPNPDADLQRLFIRQISIHGSTMGNISEFAAVLSAFASQKLNPQIDRVYHLHQHAEAFGHLTNPDRLGKVVFDLR